MTRRSGSSRLMNEDRDIMNLAAIRTVPFACRKSLKYLGFADLSDRKRRALVLDIVYYIR